MGIRDISVWKYTEIREKTDLSRVDYRIAQGRSQNRMTKEYKRINWDMRIKHAKASVLNKVEDPLLMVRRGAMRVRHGIADIERTCCNTICFCLCESRYVSEGRKTKSVLYDDRISVYLSSNFLLNWEAGKNGV